MNDKMINAHSDEIDLRELFFVLWRGKWMIMLACFFAGIVSVFYALSLPNMYKSEALLAPSEDNQQGNLGALAGQFGGLASLAGINLSGGSTDKTTIALELLKSRTFISGFIQNNDLKPTVMAVNNWDSVNNNLIYNTEIYDPDTGKWLRKVEQPRKPEPSLLEVHEVFVNELLAVSQDKETGLVRIGIEHFSPEVAKNLTDKLIAELNSTMRANDIADAEKSIVYLNSALEETAVAEMKKVFYQLIEQQQQTKMLASVRDEYALKTIDPAVVAEKKSGPRRAIICIVGVLFGLFFSCFVVLVVNRIRSVKKSK